MVAADHPAADAHRRRPRHVERVGGVEGRTVGEVRRRPTRLRDSDTERLAMRAALVTLPYAAFGIEVDECNIVRDAAPIGRWMVGKHLHAVAAWVERKEGTIQWLRNNTSC